jgi:hypothetical protein
MPQVQGTIENVQGHPSANGRTRYEVTINGQGYNTWKPDLARDAQARIGQPGSFNVTVKPSQDGQFMNYYFEGVADGAAGQIPMAAPAPIAQGAPMVQQIPIQPSAPPVAIPMAPPGSGGMSPEREAKIVKQSSMATAFNFVGHLFDGAGPEAMEEAEERALALAKRLYLQVLGAPQTLDDEIMEGLVASAPPEPEAGETW